MEDAREVQQEQKQQQQQQPKEGHAKANRPPEAKEDAVEAKAEAPADAHPAASTDGDGKAAPAPVPATAPTPARAAPRPGAQASSINPAKPNFAAMLRNSVSADVNLAAPASKPAAGKSAVGGAKQTQPAAAPKGSAPAAEGVAVPRVATGAAAAAQYGEERAEAAVLARARNAFFMQVRQWEVWDGMWGTCCGCADADRACPCSEPGPQLEGGPLTRSLERCVHPAP